MSSRQIQERLHGELEDARNTIATAKQELASNREAAAAQLSEQRCKLVDLETGHKKRDEEQTKAILQLRQDVVTLSNKLSRATNDVAFAQEQLKHEKVLHKSEMEQAIAKEQSKAMSRKYEQQSEIALLTHRSADAKRLHEQAKQVMEKLHADELRKLQIDSETRNRVHVAECEQLEQREADAIRLLETKHGRELRSAHEESENHEHQLRTEIQTMTGSHSKALVSADCNLTQANPSPR